MRAYRAPVLAVAVVVAALGVAGCGSSSDNGGGTSATSSGSASGDSGGTVAVTEKEFSIAPAAPKIAKTGPVTFTVSNTGKFPHALEVEGSGLEAKTATIQPGKTATLKVDFKKAGTYDWYCPVDNHRKMGMDGKLTVGAGGGSGSSGGTQTKSTSPSGY